MQYRGKNCNVSVAIIAVHYFQYHPILVCHTHYFHYRTENFGREKLANHELFAKFSLPIFTDTPKMYLAYALTVAYLPNFSSSIAFTCVVCQNFPVYGSWYLTIKTLQYLHPIFTSV